MRLHFGFFFTAGLLQPSNTILTPQSTFPAAVNNVAEKQTVPAANVGVTWSNAAINIDLDNLMSTKSKSGGPSLSMNQLKLQSPTKQPQQPTIQPMLSPTPLNINNNAVNNNFNSLNNNFAGPSANLFSDNVQQPINNQQLFGNLLGSINPNANNLNNQFNAFQ